MHAEIPSPGPSVVVETTIPPRGSEDGPYIDDNLARERALNYVLDDCFFSVGQVVGVRKAVDYDAVQWWRDHYRVKFTHAMKRFGNRWAADRQNVTAMAFMLGERAVGHAGSALSIDVTVARQAAADVERYCTLHARRTARASGLSNSDAVVPILAGYWCIDTQP